MEFGLGGAHRGKGPGECRDEELQVLGFALPAEIRGAGLDFDAKSIGTAYELEPLNPRPSMP